MRLHKVFNIRDGKLFSFAGVPSEWEVQYEQGVEARPIVEDTKLFCFRSMAHAIYFTRSQNIEPWTKLAEIWEVEAPHAFRMDFMCESLMPENLFGFWQGVARGVHTPPGTVAVASLTPIIKVWPEVGQMKRRGQWI